MNTWENYYCNTYRTTQLHIPINSESGDVGCEANEPRNAVSPVERHMHLRPTYHLLDDTILQTIETTPNPELKESRDLVLRIQRRELYQDYESKEKFHISGDCVRVYAKKPKLVEAVSKAFDNFQLRMYGVKAQVHETPEKKKQR